MLSKHLSGVLVTLGLFVGLTTSLPAQQNDYVLGVHDVFSITVWGQGGGSDRFTVEADGTFVFPMLGRLQVRGLTVRQLQDELTTRLRDGYFNDPRVTVAIEDYKSQRFYIVGEVKNPGTYNLTRPLTLLEALTLAGSTTESAGGIAIVRRRADGTASPGPVTQAGDGVSETRVDLSALREGVLVENPTLRDGDTIAIPRATPVYVFGYVGRPGEYTIGPETTVRQILSLAGGVAPRGATGRIKIIRRVDGNEHEVKADLDDQVRPGDTIVVPERYF